MLDSILAGSIFLREISKAKFSSMTFLAAKASSDLTPIQIECSDEAWVIIIMFIFFSDRHSKKRLENPVIPTIPLPSKFTRDTFSI